MVTTDTIEGNALLVNTLVPTIRSELVLMTPEKAKHLRKIAHFDRQRDISSRNVERLAAEMRHGRFVEGTQVYVCVLPDGLQQIVNGNHTLEAVVASDQPILLNLVYHSVANFNEVGKIYARFDIQRTRNYRDALRAHGVESIVLDTGWTAAFGSAVVYMILGFCGGFSKDVELATSRDIRVRLMRDAAEEANLYAAACAPAASRTDKKLLKRTAVMSVGIELFRYQPSGANEFFGGIARDDGLRAGTPQHTILRYLRSNVSSNSGDRYDQSRAVVLAWNAWFKNRSLQYAKPNQMGEFRILGTPWNAQFDQVKAYLPDVYAARKARAAAGLSITKPLPNSPDARAISAGR